MYLLLRLSIIGSMIITRFSILAFSVARVFRSPRVRPVDSDCHETPIGFDSLRTALHDYEGKVLPKNGDSCQPKLSSISANLEFVRR